MSIYYICPLIAAKQIKSKKLVKEKVMAKYLMYLEDLEEKDVYKK